MTKNLRPSLVAVALVTLVALVAPAAARADLINVGTLSLVTFIPGSPPSSGVITFDIANLTGNPTLDFPVSRPLTFYEATLELDAAGSPIVLGTIGHGSSFFESLLFPGDAVFVSARFRATLDLNDSRDLGLASPVVTGLLRHGNGSALLVDNDITLLTVELVPEPATLFLLGSGLAALGWKRRYRK